MIQPISFGYSHPLKTAYKKGLLPTVKFDVYGNRLTLENVSLEHIIPHSEGGTTTLDNLLLVDKKANRERGTKPIKLFMSKDMIDVYLCQFKGLKNRFINGNEYINKVKNTLLKELYK